MKPTVLVAVLITALTLGATLCRAGDQAPQAPAAPQAAPAAAAPDQVLQPSGGCMPGGGCCGSGACAQMMGAEHPHAAGDSAADTAGGCPCMKGAKTQKTE
jgi:hypothetical protein